LITTDTWIGISGATGSWTTMGWCTHTRPQRPRIAEVLAIHTDQIERYGGAPGVRDQGLLEAALYRPQTGYSSDVIACQGGKTMNNVQLG
jgi:hypothetical protein